MHPFVHRLTVIASLSAAVACGTATGDVAADDVAVDAPLTATNALRVVIREDGRLKIPAFGGDPAKYTRVSVKRRDRIELFNASPRPITIVVRFDGPPMLALEQEVHTTKRLELAPGEQTSWLADARPAPWGEYGFVCPSATNALDPEGAACRGLAFASGADPAEWEPRIFVAPF